MPALRICYNTSVSKATRKTPFSLLFGMHPRMLIFEFESVLDYDESVDEGLRRLKGMREEAIRNNLEYKSQYEKDYNKRFEAAEREVEVGQEILVENNHKTGPNPKLQKSFLGPFKVVKVKGPDVWYEDARKVKVAHLDRVKLFRSGKPETPEEKQGEGGGMCQVSQTGRLRV